MGCYSNYTSNLGSIFSILNSRILRTSIVEQSHVKLVDVQLDRTVRLITGTIKSAPVRWRPILSNRHTLDAHQYWHQTQLQQ